MQSCCASYTSSAPLPGTSLASRQSQISHHKVEIVAGPPATGAGACDGTPTGCANSASVVVYAEGKLDDNQAVVESNAEYYSLEQDFPLKQHRSCPIGNLRSARISLGGGGGFNNAASTRAFHEEAFVAQFTEEGDSDASKGLLVCCGGRNGIVWIRLVVHGWPREHYAGIVEKCTSDGGRVELDDESPTVLEYVAERLPGMFPDATVTFETTSDMGM